MASAGLKRLNLDMVRHRDHWLVCFVAWSLRHLGIGYAVEAQLKHRRTKADTWFGVDVVEWEP